MPEDPKLFRPVGGARPSRRQVLTSGLAAFLSLTRGARAGTVRIKAHAARVAFPSYKGMNYAWGRDAQGVSTFHDWLGGAYDPQLFRADLDLMAAMGARTLGLWIWLDRIVVKDQHWGAPGFVPRFDPKGVANWEDALQAMRARGMSAIVNLLQRGDPTGYVPAGYSFETPALFPEPLDPVLLGPGAENGDMTRGGGPLPDGWAASGPGKVDWLAAGSGPFPRSRCLQLAAGAAGGSARAYTPRVAVDPRRLLAIRVPVKGAVAEILVEYHDAGGTLLDYDLWWVGHDFGTTWTTLPLCSRLGNLPPGVAEIALQVVSSGTAFLGPVQIRHGRRSALWLNYLSVVEAWVRRYASQTALGGAVAGWQAIKEGYAGMQWEAWGGWIPVGVMHDFYRDFYAAVRRTGTDQPVGMDSIATVRSILETNDHGTLTNLPWYRDVADYYNLHLYNDAGAIPPQASRLDKPWVIGEAGASEQGGHYGDARYEGPALAAFLAEGRRLGARAVLAWSFTDSKALVQFEKGRAKLGPSGQAFAAARDVP